MSTTNVPELFGSMVFNDAVMKERLPKDVYKKLNTLKSISLVTIDASLRPIDLYKGFSG